MAYGRRSPTAATISDGFTLSPLPWPVLLILGVAMVFLGTSWFLNYESAVEAAEEQMGWLLLATPLVLLLLVRLLSSIENPESFFGMSARDHRRRSHRSAPSEGASPWGVAALIVLLLVLVQYQSSFLESWFV